ncbi:hypothetical protein IID20_01070, partial [Patescibacteria group bacterium]|nr:hypothetical protein [Patescibacteria group bacterium]
PVACAAWMFDAEGCKRKGGDVIKQGFDENNCELPPKCIFTTSSDSISPVICIQVITPAKNPRTGECRRFPTPCDVPADWQKVERCENELLEFNKTEEEFRLREKLRLLEEENKLSY